jgi:hypothetical protein
MSTSVSPSQGLRDQLTDDDLAKVKALYLRARDKRQPLTPERVRNHHSLLDENSRPLYSFDTIKHALENLNPPTAPVGERIRPTAENRAARQLTRDLEAMSTQSVPSSQILQIRVRYAHDRVQQAVDRNISLTSLTQRLSLALDIPSANNIRLGYLDGDVFVHLLSDDELHAALQLGTRDFAARLHGASTASSASTVADSEGVPPAQPIPDIQTQLFHQKQWAFSTHVREVVTKRATAIFSSKGMGETFGAAHLDKSIPDLFVFLQACCQLHETWVGLSREQTSVGISEKQLCEWFIEAVIGKFHPSLTSRWQSADPAIRQARQSAAFPTLAAFLATVYALVLPGVLGAPSSILPAMLRDLQGRLLKFSARRHIVAELHQTRQAVQFIQTHMYPGAAEAPDLHIKFFLEANLAKGVQAELGTVLKIHHVAELPPYFQTLDDFPPLREFSLESILRRWQALDTRPGMGDRDATEFVAAALGGPVGTRTRTRGGEPQRGAGGPPAALVPGPSTQEFTMNVNGVPTSFRQNLASWDDQHDRAREEQRFVAAVYSFPGTCRSCGQVGHLARGCPLDFKLDAGGKSTNPKCYFYTLIPPPGAMAAARPSSTGRASGTMSLRGGRLGAARPNLVAALEAMVDSNSKLETRLELMARERQRDQDRVEQLARQLDGSLGNGKAGADC